MRQLFQEVRTTSSRQRQRVCSSAHEGNNRDRQTEERERITPVFITGRDKNYLYQSNNIVVSVA